jgi:hypothetical protein
MALGGYYVGNSDSLHQTWWKNVDSQKIVFWKACRHVKVKFSLVLGVGKSRDENFLPITLIVETDYSIA